MRALVMAFITKRTRFGRYVFAIGGNPEAADLAGINVRWVIMQTFIVMGILCTVAAVVATARLNAATAGLGTNYELYTIAAAVIGGTSFAGGIGTISGAMLGALVMQSLQSGMELMGIDTPLQNVIIGIVLVVAVGIDTFYRRRLRRRGGAERWPTTAFPWSRCATSPSPSAASMPSSTPTSISTPARSSASSAATAPASRR